MANYQFENEQRLQRFIKKLENDYNGKLTPVSQISTAINAPKKTGAPFVETETDVFIPRSGRSDVITALSDARIKPQNYFQILVDPEKILPEFLKFFLNTDVGTAFRLQAMSDTAAPALNIDRIRRIEVPLPPLSAQAAVLRVYEELDQIELEVSRLKGRLEDIPASYSNIANEIKDINNTGDRFDQWVESLPYPLATILKRYTAADTSQQRQEILFYFYEAYSIFISAVLAAGLLQPELAGAEIEDVDPEYFEKSTFGSWVKLGQAMAKAVRSLMDGPGMIDSVLDSFHTDDRSLVKLLSLRDVFLILQKICDYRNAWKGHSGITSEAICAEHVRLLESELFKLQERMKDLYGKIRVIRPQSLKRHKGRFINRVEVLTGSNSIFKKAELTGAALDDAKLYMQVADTGETLELPPFFMLKDLPSGAKNACYFYSRTDGANARYVSYHFEERPESVEEGSAAFDAVNTLLKGTGPR